MINIQEQQQSKGTGWLPDPVDERDQTRLIETPTDLPDSVDLRA